MSPFADHSGAADRNLEVALEPSPPGLLDGAVAFGLGWVATAVVIGVFSGVVGLFHPVVVVLLATAGGFVISRPTWRTVERRVHPADVVVVLMVVAWIGFNAANMGQHVFAGSDPGVYNGAGWWLADSSSPLVDMAPGILEGTGVNVPASGYNDTGEGVLAPQFPRGLPVILAIARAVGGPGAFFITPTVIAGAALLAVYLLAAMFVSRAWALLAAASLAVNFVLVHFSRDAYSEPLTLLLLFGGTWLLLRSRGSPRRGMGVAAGFVIGAALCVRIDALIVMTVIPILLVHALVLGAESRDTVRTIWRASAAVVFVGLVALADLALVDASYLRAQRVRLGQVLGAIIALGIIAAVAFRYRTRIQKWIGERRTILVRGVVGILAAVALFVFVIRPLGPAARQGPHPFLAEVLEREGAVGDPTRSMAEQTGRWLWWYLGPMLIAGVLGFLELVRRILRRPDFGATALVGLVVGTAAVYLWRPSVVPLHPWAMRRFLPVVIPGLVVLGVWWLAMVVSRIEAVWPRRMAVGVAVALALSPVMTLAPNTDTTEQAGAYSFIDDICGQLPVEAALFSEASITAEQWGPALRIYCDVPVVVAAEAALPGLMTIAAEDFDVLWFGAGCGIFGEMLISASATFPITEFTATRAPDRLASDFFSIEIVRPGFYDCV